MIKERGPPGLLLSIDAKKAFDRVDWGFMIQTLETMGIGPRMIGWDKSLYHHPTAAIKVNSLMSRPFEMKNWTRQGCPLSPLLFVLSLEPLLATKRKDSSITGFKLRKEEHKISAFADEILFYVANPRKSMRNLTNILKQYGEVSNFKINLAKSEILNINLSLTEEKILKNEFKFSWTKELKYLGINLANTGDKMYKINYIPLLDEVRSDCKKFNGTSLSWLGRINSIKMVILPKVMYRFQMVPIALPQQYLRKLKMLLMNLIWKYKKTRVSFQTLRQGKRKGGLAES